MLQHNEFFKPTATLALPVTKVGDAAIGASATTKPMVLSFEVSLQTGPKSAAPAAVDIDDLVAEFESQSEAHVKAMRQGRKWLGETFYKDRPNLAQMRLNKGWSQLQLAQKAATSQSYVARLEQGKIDPQLSTMKKIADALDVSLETLAAALLQEVKR